MTLDWREILLGYPYFKHKKLINESKQWSRDEVLKYNDDQLKKHSNWEISKKKDYLKNREKFENKKYNFLTRKLTTGGTTGKPLVFKRDFLYSRQKERAYIFDIWKDIGFKPYNLRVIFRGNTSDKGKMISYNLAENAHIIDPRYLNQENRKGLYYFLKKIKPFYLHVYPSSLLSLINFLGEEEFADLSVLGILAGSEAFPISQMAYIKDTFNIPIAHWYGHSEYAALAKYCFKSGKFCFYPTYGAIEFAPSKVDGFSKMIVTSFNSIGTKFIRYETNDLCTTPTNESCDGNNFISVKSIIGREQDFFYDLGGNLNAFGPYLFGMHGEFWTYFDEIQFIQTNKGILEVLILNQTNPKLNEILNKRFLNKVNLEFKKVIRLEKTIAGKHRYFIQKAT